MKTVVVNLNNSATELEIDDVLLWGLGERGAQLELWGRSMKFAVVDSKYDEAEKILTLIVDNHPD